MKHCNIFPIALLAALSLAVPLAAARAEITAAGDVQPDISTWNSSSDGYVGYLSDGTLTVDSGSLLHSQTLTVGLGGSGTLNVNSGGTVSTRSIAGAGTVNFDGGVLQAQISTATFMQGLSGANVKAGGVTIDPYGYNVTIGQPLLADGVSAGGGLTSGKGTLTLSGANTYTGLTFVSPGPTDWETATLVLGLDAQAPVLNLGGACLSAYCARLIFDYAGGADPESTIRGLLNTPRLYALNANLPLIYSDNWALHQVIVRSALYGDADANCTVDGADLNTVLSNYLQTIPPGVDGWYWGDFNGDGTVNGGDLNVNLSYYGQSAGWSLDAAVPEPSSLLLTVAGLLALLGYIWRMSPASARRS
jgi:autotransporter-associated beta strand protein